MAPLGHPHDDLAPWPSSPSAKPLPGLAAMIVGKSDDRKVEAEEGVEEGVYEGVEDDAAVERRPI
ncbi:hypothetical protein HETIRDRAFT_438673 [Heterobasidion irregulare TC 32-1]|uniref:Uncharacterized protein n=1 Tax=Heterobasidion irregulare (strain TC 32-1) TaxID=747525 RepID=W4KLL9_HETIT|nr:uncharacterized protein HETIRDRAFT_438673 [Heterobasidion irregulare TC 32-1]ETW86250.1 hypothetical protein HETIRDRAFT_438673 [Heterobasidion irregulare TC 32-1]